jgi:outer membrane protein
MKALMNLDIANPFEVTEPNVSELSLNEITINTPEQIYEVARSNFPSIKSNSLKVAAAQKGLEARKAALYPQLGLGMQLGSNYASTLMDITDARVVGASATGNFVDVNGTSYSVMQPDIDFNTRTTPFFKQFGNNFRQTIALNLTVPLFNGWTARTAIAQAKVDIASNKLEQKRGEIKLKQDVYGAYYDAKAAAKKYFAAQQAADAAARALDFAQKRYQLGLMNAFELVTTQNTSFKSKSNAASAKYELIFKLKVIDYYLGKELKL